MLRSIARNKDALPAFPGGSNPVARLAVMQSFPEWLIRRWIKRFGADETESLCEFINTIPPVSLRVNTLKTDRDYLLALLQEDAELLEKTRYAPEGLVMRHPGRPLHRLEAFEKGYFAVQDEAAQLISHILSPLPGQNVLDACAGLGGKTGHLAQLMKDSGSITALDKDPGKLVRLSAHMDRLGIHIVSPTARDLVDDQAQRLTPGAFDRILLDAPCSGLGVIRRNPDIKWDAARQNLGRFGDIQANAWMRFQCC